MDPFEKTAEELASMGDADLNYSDNPATDASFWKDASWKRHPNQPGARIAVPVVVDERVIAFFQKQGDDLSALMGAVLREHVDRHATGEG